ncbi:MAG: hypothetical protein DMF84_05535 [Acidobacteria bacterium]|nr:MAG: hypothetical protein DMF84_05535 [Acidobacteriota bacterium]
MRARSSLSPSRECYRCTRDSSSGRACADGIVPFALRTCQIGGRRTVVGGRLAEVGRQRSIGGGRSAELSKRTAVGVRRRRRKTVQVLLRGPGVARNRVIRRRLGLPVAGTSILVVLAVRLIS